VDRVKLFLRHLLLSFVTRGDALWMPKPLLWAIQTEVKGNSWLLSTIRNTDGGIGVRVACHVRCFVPGTQ
jgi:hypothetical protein